MLAHATGRLGLAHSLVVEAHLAICPECRHSVPLMHAVGGCCTTTYPRPRSPQERWNAP